MARLLIILLFFNTIALFGQISPEKLATGRMEKGKWQKTGQSLRKAIAKDSLNPEAHYIMCLYFFTARNPEFNIDSAHLYVSSSWRTYRLATIKDRERLKRVPLDSTYLVRLTLGID